MEFKKYSSIENHYQQKFIGSFVNQFGTEALNQPFAVSEKLDGANIQLVFQPNQEFKVGKRTSYLTREDSFFDIWNTLDKYIMIWQRFQDFVDKEQRSLTVYGEIYGIGINGRINYGNEKFIKIFDLLMDDEYLSQVEMIDFLHRNFMETMLPTYFIKNSLAEALETEIPDNCEGWVIQPLNKLIRMGSGARFILKKKAEKFDDTVSDKVREKRNAGENVFNLKFREYINENRLKDLFSKHGEIQRPQQIPDYIKLMMEDAKADFLKDHDISAYEPKEQKEIFNVGSMIVLILKKYL